MSDQYSNMVEDLGGDDGKGPDWIDQSVPHIIDGFEELLDIHARFHEQYPEDA